MTTHHSSALPESSVAETTVSETTLPENTVPRPTVPEPMLKTRAWAVFAAAAFGLTACAGGGDDADHDAPGSGDAETSSEETPLDIRDTWVRATDTEMTGVFGELENTGDEDLEIVSAESDVAGAVELHEVVEDEDGTEQMREVDGGFPVPAGGTLTLSPGDDHLMLMGLDEELHPGDEVEIELILSDDTVVTLEALVKDEGGQDSPYDEGEDQSGEDHDAHEG